MKVRLKSATRARGDPKETGTSPGFQGPVAAAPKQRLGEVVASAESCPGVGKCLGGHSAPEPGQGERPFSQLAAVTTH